MATGWKWTPLSSELSHPERLLVPGGGSGLQLAGSGGDPPLAFCFCSAGSRLLKTPVWLSFFALLFHLRRGHWGWHSWPCLHHSSCQTRNPSPPVHGPVRVVLPPWKPLLFDFYCGSEISGRFEDSFSSFSLVTYSGGVNVSPEYCPRTSGETAALRARTFPASLNLRSHFPAAVAAVAAATAARACPARSPRARLPRNVGHSKPFHLQSLVTQ